MKKTDIEWCDYTINPVKGLCPVACSYCYARRLYKRFKWDNEIRWDDSVFWNPLTGKPGDKYFIGSTMELFGEWIEDWWMSTIFEWVRSYPLRTFILLTKRPQNLLKWSPFPDNCYVGVSATDDDMLSSAILYLHNIKAKVKYISFEPLLGQMKDLSFTLKYSHIADWIIIGQQTPPSITTSPKMLWIQDILVAASNAGNIPVFMKNNLKPLLVGQWAGWKLRQEFPSK